MTHTKHRNEYGSTRRRFAFSADRMTERRILDAQNQLSEITGVPPTVSASIAYLIKLGHKAIVSETYPNAPKQVNSNERTQHRGT
jgi:hypothetical protein